MVHARRPLGAGSWDASARPTDELAAGRRAADRRPLPPLVLTDDTPDLMLTWVTLGATRTPVGKPADVPTEGRDQVRVVVTTREDGTRDLFYVTNLTVKNPDGSYPGHHDAATANGMR